MKRKKRDRGSDHYGDITAWTAGDPQFRDRLNQPKETKAIFWSARVRLADVEPRFAYALMVEFIAPRPNGIFTFLAQGLPCDNMVWWDFFLGADEHLMNLVSGVNGLEVEVYSLPPDFDVERFFRRNIARHRQRLLRRIETFERHEIYANPYRSHRRSLEWLHKEILTIDTALPALAGGVRTDRATAERELDLFKEFNRSAIKFHVLAKSLLVTAAFMGEALVSTLLRVAALPHLRADPERLLRPLLRASLFQKLEVIHAYTFLFPRRLDLKAEPVRRFRELMEKRNKYVHAEFSEHTRLNDVHFDEDFPLYGGGASGQLLEFVTRTYLTPSRQDVLDAVEVAEQFDSFIRAAMHAEIREHLEFVLQQPQLGYNTKKKVYSVPFTTSPFQTLVMPLPHEDEG